jgi:hypothetical protein
MARPALRSIGASPRFASNAESISGLEELSIRTMLPPTHHCPFGHLYAVAWRATLRL